MLLSNMVKKSRLIILKLSVLPVVIILIFSGCTQSSISDVYSTSVSITSEINTTVTKDIVKPTPAPTNSPEPLPDSQIVIGFAGDILMHEAIMNVAKYNGNSFDICFEKISSALSYPDIMVVNLEGPLAGDDVISYGYPAFNVPDEICDSLNNYGVDVVLNGNNHILDWWASSAERTIDVLDSYNLTHTGIWKKDESKAPLIIEANGIKVGIINPTESINGYTDSLDTDPVASMVVLAQDYEEIKKQINELKTMNADIIIVSPHMGEEFRYTTNEKYYEIAEKYLLLGADAVIAHHPHTVQSAEEITVTLDNGCTKTGIVYFSIGNLIGDMFSNNCETGVIAYLNIQKNNNTGKTTITSSQYLPICIQKNAGYYDLYYIMPLEADETDSELLSYRNKIVNHINSDIITAMDKIP